MPVRQGHTPFAAMLLLLLLRVATVYHCRRPTGWYRKTEQSFTAAS